MTRRLPNALPPDFSLNNLGEGQQFVDTYEYTVTDGSFIFANDDVFKVAADNANLFLDVLANDRNLAGTGSDLEIIAVGTPSSGGFAAPGIDADGNPGITYSPEVNFVGDEYFTYTVSDAEGNIDSALVIARPTVEQLNGNLQANDDAFTVAKGQSPVLNVLANDDRIPDDGTELTITQIVTQPAEDTVTLTNNELVFEQTGSGPFPYTTSFSYEISGGGSALAVATVTVKVIDREDTLELRDDAFGILVGSVNNSLDVLSNDNILPGSSENLVVKHGERSSEWRGGCRRRRIGPVHRDLRPRHRLCRYRYVHLRRQ